MSETFKFKKKKRNAQFLNQNHSDPKRVRHVRVAFDAILKMDLSALRSTFVEADDLKIDGHDNGITRND